MKKLLTLDWIDTIISKAVENGDLPVDVEIGNIELIKHVDTPAGSKYDVHMVLVNNESIEFRIDVATREVEVDL